MALKGESDFDRSALGSEASKMAISDIILYGYRAETTVMLLKGYQVRVVPRDVAA